MAPLEDGTVPPVPYKFTSIFRELMSYVDSDDRQLIDSATMTKSGPRTGYCLLTFRQTDECEEFAVKIASNPCAMLRQLCLNVKGFREDMVINLCKSFEIAARGRSLHFGWDPETWSLTSDSDDFDGDFLDDLVNDGYVLTDDMKENQGSDKMVEVSRVVAESDMEMLKQMGVCSDDATLGTKDGVSVIGGASHATQGQSSVRTENTQQRRRNMDEKNIAEALANEQAAALRWRDIAFAATGTTGLYSSPTSEHPENPTNPPSTTPSANPQGATSPTSSPNSHPNLPVNNTGVPASSKQSGLGNESPQSNMGGDAEGPQGIQ
jgi:hypothetical protein